MPTTTIESTIEELIGSAFTDLDLDLDDHRSGKVRESWRLPSGERLLVTTDRLSAMDRVVGAAPFKGQVLNQVAAWWFDQSSDLIANHIVSLPDPNVTVAVDAKPLPIEVVVRGHITGSTSTSLWTMYEAGGRTLYGHDLPDGLTKHQRLPEPLITPTTKAEQGAHDEPIESADVAARGLVDADDWARVCETALALFRRGQEIADEAGFILADTKYEFGYSPEGELLLIDEVHTPDSSRFWRADTFAERVEQGLDPESHDKEPMRLALKATGWTGDGPAPELPAQAWIDTSTRYIEFYEGLTGDAFVPGSYPAEQRISDALRNARVIS